MCTCGCATKKAEEKTQAEEKKTYLCIQCNTFKVADAPPECCGKKMNEMD